jgi:hypothetical protein
MADYDGKEYREEDEGTDGHQKVLELLQKAQDADHDMRENAREAFLFVTKRDGQWEPYWWSSNTAKPRYTFDMVTPIIDQVAGELEQADFDIRVNPAGGSATKDVANTFDGMIRNIENISNAKVTYNQAGRGMVTTGYDGWRVSQKYIDDDSFDQDLVIEKIANFIDRVWFDPSAELQDKSDAKYCFVLHPVEVDEYDRRWPEGGREGVSDDRDGDAYFDKAEVILVGEYLYVEEEERELVMINNGHVYEAEEFDKIKDELAAIGVEEVRRRKRMDKKVCSRFFDAKGWLEDDKDTVFSSIPVVPVYANYKVFESKTLYAGVVDKLIDPQRVLNYSMSREIEEGALAPRAKYWMTMAQAAGHEDQLSTLNTNSDPVQFFNVDPENPGAPQQQGGALVNPGLRTITEAMRGMIGYAAGMFAANMGDNPGLQSGVAINSLQNKGDTATIKYNKALQIAIRRTGELLVKAIPKVYDTPRTVRIMKEDREYSMAEVNAQVFDQDTQEFVTVNDLSAGKYDVVCRAGPSFRNRQQETIEAIIEIAKVDPSIIQLGGDILLDNISTPAAEQLSNRKRAMMLQQGIIPMNQMTEEELAEQQQKMAMAGQQQAPDPAMVLAQAEQMKAEAEMLRSQIEMQKLQNEQVKLQLEAQKLQTQTIGDQADNQIDAFNAQTKRMEAQIKAQQAGATIDHTAAKTMGEELENQQKMSDMMEEQALKARIPFMTEAELMSLANTK